MPPEMKNAEAIQMMSRSLAELKNATITTSYYKIHPTPMV